MNPALAVERPPPCELCRGKRWRTLAKWSRWKCRECGLIRAVNDKGAQEAA